MFLVAITGGIATGKSTVSKVFKDIGIPIIDADQIAREIVQPGKPCWLKIRQAFGDEILLENKEIDRAALGQMVFSDKVLRGRLNKITHPVIHREIFLQIFKHFITGKSWIVLELPLLFETGILINFIHKIICVTCDSDIQLQRLMERNELTAEDAKHRIDSQMPLERKCELSHFVIDNSGSEEETIAATLRVLNIIKESKQHWRNRITLLSVIFLILFAIYYINKFFNFLPHFNNLLPW